MMHIHCLGLNHRTASLNLRERLSFQEDRLKAVLSDFGCGQGCKPESVSEMAILSTCNRVELYAVSSCPDSESLVGFLEQTQGIAAAEFRPHLYHLLDEEASTHLFRVAAGLDSLVLGEPQILGQVTAAFEAARDQGAAGPILSRLFQAALRAGKRARAETAISQNPSSVASVAAHLAEETVVNLKQACVVVLGAGEMAELAVEALRKRGVADTLVLNRTLEKASLLAEHWEGRAASLKHLPQALEGADILITSTSAPHTLIQMELVAPIMANRHGRPMVIIDIAVPRDVDEAVGSLPGVRLYDLDSLHAYLKDSLARRSNEVPQVEAILSEEQAAFQEYLHSLSVVPVIAAMYRRAERLRQTELEKTLRAMPDLPPEDRRRLESLTGALVKKLLHAPAARLRAEAGSPQAVHYAAAARALFDLDDGSGLEFSKTGKSIHF